MYGCLKISTLGVEDKGGTKMCEPLVIDIDDIIKLNDELARWKVLDFNYNNEDPTLATQIILDVEEDFGMGAPKQINPGIHIIMDRHKWHFDVNSWIPQPNQITLDVTYKHTVE